MRRLLLITIVCLLAAACRTLPANVERQASFAFEAPETTELGKMFSVDAKTHSGDSGFSPVVAGSDAFLLRSAFAALAQRTLDLQYYIWEEDTTGRMLLRDVMRAAERGVRVRLLIDDAHTKAATRTFDIVDAHPMIEVRLFNPFANRGARIVDVITNGTRINHRMHNKVIIPDNALALTGGRNIGDHYFAVDKAMNFRDLDLFAAGPVVQELSAMFDNYWNSEWAYPIAALTGERHTYEEALGLLEFLENWIAAQPEPPFAPDAGVDAMRERIAGHREVLAWGPAKVVFDPPDKIVGTGAPRVAELLFDSVNGVGHELLIETAYFIPGDSGVDILESLVDRGIEIKLLTNSLATNDIVPAHAGYRKFRADTLRAGVDLYELRPDALADQREKNMLSSDSKATLHTKALVYDRHTVFVGSFNLDPRSLLINTEMGVLVRNEALAQQVAEIMLYAMQPENSYKVVLQDGDVRWQSVTPEGVELLDREPETGWWTRFLVNVMALLPITGQL